MKLCQVTVVTGDDGYKIRFGDMVRLGLGLMVGLGVRVVVKIRVSYIFCLELVLGLSLVKVWV